MLQAGLRVRRRRCRDRCGCPAGSVRVPQPKTRASPCPSPVHPLVARPEGVVTRFIHRVDRIWVGRRSFRQAELIPKNGVVQLRVTLETGNPLASTALAIFRALVHLRLGSLMISAAYSLYLR